MEINGKPLIAEKDVTVGSISHRDILECGPETSLKEAAGIMYEARCGSIIVVEDGKHVGIWTESDALSIGFDDARNLNTPISEAMSSPLKSVPSDTLVEEAGMLFNREGFRHLLVVDDDGGAIGVVSQTDIVLLCAAEYLFLLSNVGSIMEHSLQTVSGKTPVSEVVKEMKAASKDAVIVEADSDEGPGIITERDIVRLIVEGRTSCTAGEVASRPLITIPHETSLIAAREMMEGYSVRHLAITGKNGEFVGLVSFSDFLRGVQYSYFQQLEKSLEKRTKDLRESEEKFRAIFQSSEVAMIVAIDDNGNLVKWNPGAERSFGYSEDEILGQPLLRLIPERYQEAHSAGLKRAIEMGEYRIIGKKVEVAGVHKDGHEFPIELSIGTWRSEDRVYFSAIINDITERKRAEEEMIKAKEDAEKANEAKSEFLASMSHELRTPLNAVLGFAQMLQFDPKTPLSPAQNEHVENILAGGNHLLELVNEILDLARIEANQLDLSIQDVNTNNVVADCVVLTAPLGEPRGINIVDQISGGAPVHIHTDRLRFKQTLLNLLSNAIKFNKDGGTVTVDGREIDGKFFRISVTDTGPGIAKEDYSSVFKIFHRLDADPMIAQEGTGIGLTVSKLLVERMAGRIGFESEQGVGSTFWIKLPLASNEDVLIWTDAVRIGVDALDKDHQALFALLNRIILQSEEDVDLDQVIEELIDYTHYHFRREEAIMEACRYPDLEKHCGLHRKLAAQVNDLADTWQKDHNPETLQHLRKFLREWLSDHITKEDTKIFQYTKGMEQEIRKVLKNHE